MLLDNQREVTFVENVTDIDDPLFERAERDGIDWRELAADQINLFRNDMATLSVIPPAAFVGATEVIPEVIELVGNLVEAGAAYVVDDAEFPDIYARFDATSEFGYVSHYSRAVMDELFAERGGDPQRPGKKDSLDALIWRAERPGEPSWDSPFGPGRPGWHVECAAIAAKYLSVPFTIQGGGSDLQFPHHEYSAAHAEAGYHTSRMASHYVHTGMIALEGTKMSKSLGNLVFINELTKKGHDPSAMRLGVFNSHYRGDRDWSQEILEEGERRLATWRAAAARPTDPEADRRAVAGLRQCLADDLDTPAALAVIDEWAIAGAAHGHDSAGSSGPAEHDKHLVARALKALLGVSLLP